MPNGKIEVTPELVRAVDAMTWRGLAKLALLFLVVAGGSIAIYHYTAGSSEARFDSIEDRLTRIEDALS